MTLPVGHGIAVTQPGKLTTSVTRAAGTPPIRTVADPIMTLPGIPGVHPGG
jgi:hypothetical protein